jgi:hypothetical protein
MSADSSPQGSAHTGLEVGPTPSVAGPVDDLSPKESLLCVVTGVTGYVGGRLVPELLAPSDPLPSDPDWAGGSLYRDDREIRVDAPAEVVWRVLEEIGGDRGWYSWPLAWWARGFLDRLVGGPGMRRGRRDPQQP